MKRALFAARYYNSLMMAAKEPGKHSWYRIDINTKADSADVYVYDEIGFWGVGANDFIRDLKKIETALLNLRVNSPGGIVTEGHAMFNALCEHKAVVTTYNDALAASMGSVLMLAGSPVYGGGGIKTAKNAMWMIHNPWGIAIGDDEDFIKEAEILAKMKGILADGYVDVTGKERDEIIAAMKGETWLTADEAKEFGLTDEVTNTAKARVQSDHLAYFSNVPEKVKALATAKEEAPGESEEEAPDYDNERKKLELLELE